jgi:hypothetical protein
MRGAVWDGMPSVENSTVFSSDGRALSAIHTRKPKRTQPRTRSKTVRVTTHKSYRVDRSSYRHPVRRWRRCGKPASRRLVVHNARRPARGAPGILGQKDIKMTLRYAHLSPGHLRTEIEKTATNQARIDGAVSKSAHDARVEPSPRVNAGKAGVAGLKLPQKGDLVPSTIGSLMPIP